MEEPTVMSNVVRTTITMGYALNTVKLYSKILELTIKANDIDISYKHNSTGSGQFTHNPVNVLQTQYRFFLCFFFWLRFNAFDSRFHFN